MMKFLCSSLLLALVSPVVARMKSGVASEHERVMALYQEKVRSLQGDGAGRDLNDFDLLNFDLLDGICTELLEATIGGVGAALLGDTFACGCDIELLPPSILATCGTTDPVCFVPPDIVCGVPALSFGIDFLAILQGDFPLTGEVCYNNLLLFNQGGLQLPLCIGVDASLFQIFGLGEDSANVTIPEGALDDACTAKVGDEECTSCEVCPGGLISFNCTEFHPELIATCTDLGVIPTSFADLSQVDEVTLSLDGFE